MSNEEDDRVTENRIPSAPPSWINGQNTPTETPKAKRTRRTKAQIAEAKSSAPYSPVEIHPLDVSIPVDHALSTPSFSPVWLENAEHGPMTWREAANKIGPLFIAMLALFVSLAAFLK